MQTIPYLIVSQDVDTPLALGVTQAVKIFVCINLLDHRAVGIATTRGAALADMAANYNRLNATSGCFQGVESCEN